NEFVKQLEALLLSGSDQLRHSRDITARAAETGSKARSNRIGTTQDYDRNRVRRRLGRQPGDGSPSRGNDHIHSMPNQVSRQFRESIVLPFGPAIFDANIAAFVKTGFSQTVVEFIQQGRVCLGRVQEPDYRRRGPLRANGDRQTDCRACEQHDEFPPPHSITSSARATSEGGTARPRALAVLRLITK